MILLVNPRMTTTLLNRHLETFTFNSMPIGLGFLAGYLHSKDILTKILDDQLMVLHPEFIKQEVDGLDNPKIVGISVLTSTYKRTCQIAAMIKDADPQSIVVLGGIHPTATPEECLSEPFFDIIVRGEGEETLYQVVKTLKSKASLTNVAGISYKNNGKIIHNPDRPLISNLDDIPSFPYHLFGNNISVYKEFGIVVSSRGCPYRCIFCSSRLISKFQYRTHSINRIIDDIDILINKYNQTSLSFLDDNIFCNKDRFLEMINIIMKKGFHKKAKFYICARGQDVTDELCNKLKSANFELAVNFEAGTNRMLKVVKKGETVEDNINAILKAKKYDLNVTSVFIFGFPSENSYDRKEAIRLSRRLPMDSVRFNIAIPYPGTELYDIAKGNNRLNVKGKYENFSVQQYLENDELPFVLPPKEKQKVLFDVFWANLSFYLRPIFLIKNLSKKSFAGHAISFNLEHPFLLFKDGLILAIILIRRFALICVKRFIIFFNVDGR